MSNTKQQIEDILDGYANHNYSQSPDFHLTPDMQFMDREQTVEAIDRLVTEACLQEFKTMWNKTQPDVVPEGWEPDTEEGEYIKDRIAELQSQLNEEQK